MSLNLGKRTFSARPNVEMERETPILNDTLRIPGRPPSERLAPTAELDAYNKVVWCAAYIEGRGAFWRNGRQVGLTIQSPNTQPLKRLRKYFGGDIYEIGGKPRYIITGRRAQRMFAELSPLLSPIRRREAETKWAIPEKYKKHVTHHLYDDAETEPLLADE